MKHLITAILLALAFASSSAWSDPRIFSTGTDASQDCEIKAPGLPDSEVQRLKVECETARLKQGAQEKDDKTIKGLSPKDVTNWAGIAQEFAKALGMAAHELGVSINEFLGTSAGKITAVVLFWKLLGRDLLVLMSIPVVFYIASIPTRKIWFSHVEQKDVVLFGIKLFSYEKTRYKTMNDFSRNEEGYIAIPLVLTVLSIGYMVVALAVIG